jgi:chromosome segregation ATPase
MSQGKCRKCGKSIPLYREYCSKACLKEASFSRRVAGEKAEAVEYAGLSRVQAELLLAKGQIERLEAVNGALEATAHAQASDIEVLKAQVASHDSRIMDLTLLVKDLARQLRAIQKDRNTSGQAWDIGIPENF